MNEPRQTVGAAAEEQMLLLAYRMRDRLMNDHAYTEALATEIAMLCIDTLRDEHGGERLYVAAPSKHSRNAAVRAELRTGNAEDVAKRHGISVRRVYEIAGSR